MCFHDDQRKDENKNEEREKKESLKIITNLELN